MSGCACHGGPVGDPEVAERLREVVGELLEAARSSEPDALQRALDGVEEEVRGYGRDQNPRTRAQVRGVLMVHKLLAGGEAEAAVDLLEGELARSFPDPPVEAPTD